VEAVWHLPVLSVECVRGVVGGGGGWWGGETPKFLVMISMNSFHISIFDVSALYTDVSTSHTAEISPALRFLSALCSAFWALSTS
jgi:hypothetical protein